MRTAIPYFFQQHRRAFTGAFIAWTLVAFVAQSLPPDSLFHEQVNRFFTPYLSITGTWIGSTSFFSPTPPKDMMQVEGRVYYENGKYQSWVTPEVSQLSLIDKLVYARGIKYFDNLYRDANASTWPFFAHYLLQRMRRPDTKEVRVELIRRWRNTPVPHGDWWTSLQPWHGEEGYPHEYLFYRSNR